MTKSQDRSSEGHDLESAILAQAHKSGAQKSFCPSEVARALESQEAAWRRLLKPIRTSATKLAQSGQIEILRHGKPVDPHEPFKGVIRLRLASDQNPA